MNEIDFFVDSSLLIAHLRQTRTPTVLELGLEHHGIAGASDVIVFELEVGARRAGRSFEYQTHFADIPTFALTQEILMKAASIQATLNIQHFQRVDGLKILTPPTRS